jgi:hypothetical protein
MAAHNFPLFLSKRAGFVEDVVSHPYLSQVMQRPGRANELDITVAQLKLFTKATCEFSYPDGV